MADNADWHVLVRLRDGSTQTWGPHGPAYRTPQPDVREWLCLPLPHHRRPPPEPWDIIAVTVIGEPPPDVAVVLTTMRGDYDLFEFPVSEFTRWQYVAHIEGRGR